MPNKDSIIVNIALIMQIMVSCCMFCNSETYRKKNLLTVSSLTVDFVRFYPKNEMLSKMWKKIVFTLTVSYYIKYDTLSSSAVQQFRSSVLVNFIFRKFN